MTLDDVLIELKALRRYDQVEVHSDCECCGGWTENRYSDSGDHISAYAIEDLIKKIEEYVE